MGQEWGDRQPFPFFCDFGDDLAPLVYEGRQREFAAFPLFGDQQGNTKIPDPNDAATFTRAILDWGDINRQPHLERLAFHKQLLAIRRLEIMPYVQGFSCRSNQYEPIGDHGLLVRWLHEAAGSLTMVANLEAGKGFGFRQPGGRLLYRWPENQQHPAPDGSMPPWSVAFYSTLKNSHRCS